MKQENKKPKKFVGRLPINCRIDVDYTGEKPNVKFGYPHKKEQKHLASTGPHVMIFLILYVLISIGLFFLFINWLRIPTVTPTNCTANFTTTDTYAGIIHPYFNQSNKTIKGNQVFQNWTIGSVAVYNRSIGGVIIKCNNNFTQNFSYNEFRVRGGDNVAVKSIIGIFHSEVIFGFYEEVPDTNSILLIIFAIVMYVGFILWLVLFVYLNRYLSRFLLRFKWYQKMIPEYNARLAGRAYYKIIKEVPENKIVELPLFKNVKLDYNVKGEFSKYLKKVEIREHPFCKGIFKKGKLVNKKGNNYILWYARFYFSERPKNGELLIWFK